MSEAVVVKCPSCGAQFRVGAENVGKLFTCAQCRQPFQASLDAAASPPPPPGYGGAPPQYVPASVEYAASNQMQGTSGMAIASLVCGIFICIFPASVLALVFGIIGINQTKPGQAKGRGMAIAGTVLGAIGVTLVVPAILISILLPSLNKARETANRAKCASNMHQIGLALMLYQNDNQQAYPPDLQTLAQHEQLGLSCFVCPSSNDTVAPDLAHLTSGGHCSYVYSGSALDGRHLQPTDVVLYENGADHPGQGTNILFGDGHVAWFTAVAAKQFLSRIPVKY